MGNSVNISELGLECSACSSCSNFSFVDKHPIWRWEIDIPYDWEYGQWERIRLYPVQVDILIVKCEICGEVYRVYPSFIIKGTTLTLSALVFVAFTYESSGFVWRAIPEKFCDEHNMIAHSTLYKAVHGLGKSIVDSDNRIKDGIKELKEKYSHKTNEKSEVFAWHPEKSLHEHTLQREAALRSLLSPLVCLKFTYCDFPRLFYTYIRPLRLILSNIDPPIQRLYIK